MREDARASVPVSAAAARCCCNIVQHSHRTGQQKTLRCCAGRQHCKIHRSRARQQPPEACDKARPASRSEGKPLARNAPASRSAAHLSCSPVLVACHARLGPARLSCSRLSSSSSLATRRSPLAAVSSPARRPRLCKANAASTAERNERTFYQC